MVNRVVTHIVAEKAGIYPVEYGPRVTQDAVLVRTELKGHPDVQIYGVFDGHGPEGHFVARLVALKVRGVRGEGASCRALLPRDVRGRATCVRKVRTT